MIEQVEFDNIKEILKKEFKNEIPINFEKGPYNHSIAYILNDNIIGILNYDLIYERIEINYIFVFEKYRNKNIGSNLLEYLIQNNIFDNITLEVNKNNIAAIKLYEKYGFQKTAIREKYYNGEDAFLMMRN